MHLHVSRCWCRIALLRPTCSSEPRGASRCPTDLRSSSPPSDTPQWELTHHVQPDGPPGLSDDRVQGFARNSVKALAARHSSRLSRPLLCGSGRRSAVPQPRPRPDAGSAASATQAAVQKRLAANAPRLSPGTGPALGVTAGSTPPPAQLGRMQLPADTEQSGRLPVERAGAVVTVLLPGSTGRLARSSAAPQPMDARGRLTLTSATVGAHHLFRGSPVPSNPWVGHRPGTTHCSARQMDRPSTAVLETC